MPRVRSRQVETESVNQRMLRRGAVKRQHISRWAVGDDELAPGVVGGKHLHPSAIERIREVAGEVESAGATITVLQSTQAIPAGGAQLAWASVHPVSVPTGFDDLSLPAADLPIPLSGYWQVIVRFGWDSWRLGGTVAVTLDGVPVDSITGTFGTRFEHVFALGVCDEGQVVGVTVDHGDDTGHDLVNAQLTLELVHRPAGIAVEASPYIFGFAADPAEVSSAVTITGNARIDAGDLLLAFATVQEPVLNYPSGWTVVHDEDFGGGGEVYAMLKRTAATGDDDAAWTWSSTHLPGHGSDMAMGVRVAILGPGLDVDGTPDFERQAPGTAMTLTTTTSEATGLLYCAVLSAAGSVNVSGLTKVIDETRPSNLAPYTWNYTLWVADITAGFQSVSITAASGTLVGQLVAVG